ncbi:21186_t:CDS:2 [Dentiscutata erythropus]|uniref:21186_t:CDS:1 n=1 Tax=Dentiscutata erythropus TaxID=1348616 RepID=A0A9N9EFC4_9GLOM|nr:21186_t:CDS:2 [Dentiscutata erythropus]
MKNRLCQELQNIEYSKIGYVVSKFHNGYQGCKGLEKVGYKNDSLEGLEGFRVFEQTRGFEDRKYNVKMGPGNY